MQKDHHEYHQPVLLDRVLQYLNPQKGETYLDVTAGYGGHACAILERTLQDRASVLIDRDRYAVDELQKQFADSGIKIIHSDFLSGCKELAAEGKGFDIILADLGVSSPHLDNASRGFSFQKTGPLDMRMDTSQELTASDIVNHSSETELIRIIREYGEEPRARKIVHGIIENRPFVTTTELAQCIATIFPQRGQKTHPATRTFQALRIAVNSELELLRAALPLWLELLNPGGRIGVISFHSLEDRIVKQFFAQETGDRYDASMRLLTKKPITGSTNEIVLNPRARSAKLRAAVKIKTERELHANSGKK